MSRANFPRLFFQALSPSWSRNETKALQPHVLDCLILKQVARVLLPFRNSLAGISTAVLEHRPVLERKTEMLRARSVKAVLSYRAPGTQRTAMSSRLQESKLSEAACVFLKSHGSYFQLSLWPLHSFRLRTRRSIPMSPM